MSSDLVSHRVDRLLPSSSTQVTDVEDLTIHNKLSFLKR